MPSAHPVGPHEAVYAGERVSGDRESRRYRGDAPACRALAVGAIGDVDDVAVVVEAGFDEQVGIDGAAQLDGC